MAWKNTRRTRWMVFTIAGSLFGSNHLFAAEEADKTKKSSVVIVQNKTTPASKADHEPFSALGTPGSTRFDFDSLSKLMEENKTPLAAMMPNWLNVAIEQRTRYEVYDHGFTKAIPGFDEQVNQRTRFLFEVKNIIDPLKFTLELTDIRASLARYGQEHNPNMADHFDFTQMRLGVHGKSFLNTGYAAKFEVGRFMMDLGESRLVGGHRWGSYSPSFDGLHFMMGNTDEKWSLRVFGARPVQRVTTELDWNTPATYFSGAYVTNRDQHWANFDGYFLQLNESDHLKRRNLSTTGFRLFAKPTKGSMDYEIESMYQFGDTRGESVFAHRHHGEVGYSFSTPMPLRAVYLFDFASGDRNPDKNFDVLYARRRVEYGPTGMLGAFFPSNLMSPVGFRATLIPIPNVRLMMSHRAYWLADKHGAYVGSGLQDPTGRAGSFLGNMLDISLGWDPQWSYLKRMSFDFGYSHIFKGDYFDKVPSSPGMKDTNYGYTMVTFKF